MILAQQFHTLYHMFEYRDVILVRRVNLAKTDIKFKVR